MWLWKDTAANWYHHKPDPVCHTEKYKLSCDFKIQLDHYIEHNKSDIVLLNKAPSPRIKPHQNLLKWIQFNTMFSSLIKHQ